MKMISLRLNADELSALEQAAKADKLKLTTWIKQAAMKAADTKAKQIISSENKQNDIVMTE